MGYLKLASVQIGTLVYSATVGLLPLPDKALALGSWSSAQSVGVFKVHRCYTPEGAHQFYVAPK
jgi:hypothetical protein